MRSESAEPLTFVLEGAKWHYLGFSFEVADVAELADAIDLGSIARQGVEVRVLSSALLQCGMMNAECGIKNS